MRQLRCAPVRRGSPGVARCFRAQRTLVGFRQREVAFLFLGEVQAEHGVQAVQGGEQVLDLVVADVLARFSEVQVRADPGAESVDLGVHAAHRRGGLGAAQCGGDERGVELSFLGSFVRNEPLIQEFTGLT